MTIRSSFQHNCLPFPRFRHSRIITLSTTCLAPPDLVSLVGHKLRQLVYQPTISITNQFSITILSFFLPPSLSPPNSQPPRSPHHLSQLHHQSYTYWFLPVIILAEPPLHLISWVQHTSTILLVRSGCFTCDRCAILFCLHIHITVRRLGSLGKETPSWFMSLWPQLSVCTQITGAVTTSSSVGSGLTDPSLPQGRPSMHMALRHTGY